MYIVAYILHTFIYFSIHFRKFNYLISKTQTFLNIFL